jgi:hypothetical protein
VRLAAANGEEIWLAYGMNVHPGGDVESTEAALRSTVLPLRERLGVRGPFGVSLRFDGQSVARLAHDADVRQRLAGLLAENDLVPFTANGFVVGRFHGGRVKEEVYRPTWRERERVAYTLALADAMIALRGAGHVVSISTMPGSWRPWGEGERVARDCAAQLVACARRLREREEDTGTRVVLGLEAEPRCTIETTREMVEFFRGPLSEAFGRDRGALRHLGVTFDVCHMAVVHEDVAASLDLLRESRIPVVKVQASCAIVVADPRSPAAREALASFDEPTYLHQVGARDADGTRHVAVDLPEALRDEGGAWAGRAPWRVHFHVPVFREVSVPPLGTTRDDLDRVLARVAAGDVTPHLEIETYTWGVLPEAERRRGSGSDLVEALAREYEHVLGVLEAHGVRRVREEAAR